MKKWLLILLSCAFISANAQTVEEVIEKYSKTMGGLDSFNKVNTAKMSGTITSNGLAMPMITQIVQGKAMRTDVNAIGKTITNVYNNGKGWKVNPVQNIISPVVVVGDELNSFKLQASLVNNLMDYKNRGHKVELIAHEEVDGIKTFKIKLTGRDDNKSTFYFIDTTTFLLLKSISTRETQGKQYDVATYYSDMKSINGLQFSFLLIQKIQGQTFLSVKWDKIELNVPVNEKIFTLAP